MSAESWRKKAETLEFSNTRLKEEAVKREEQITQIKTKFRSIVEELKKRELPDGSTAVQGGGGRDDADVQLGLQERRIKELARKLAAAHKASQDAGKLSDEWERKYRQQLRRASVPGRSTSPSVAQRKDDAKHSDLWKRKYMDLQQSLKKEGGASKVQTVRALRPRKVPYNAEPMEVGHEASRSPTTSPQAEFLSRQPVLMNAWVQTAGWEPEVCPLTQSTAKPHHTGTHCRARGDALPAQPCPAQQPCPHATCADPRDDSNDRYLAADAEPAAGDTRQL